MAWLGRLTARLCNSSSRSRSGCGAKRRRRRYLQRRGYRILARRDRSRPGELDLVALDGSTVVFVEVKTRTSAEAGHPVEAVGADKQRRPDAIGRDLAQAARNARASGAVRRGRRHLAPELPATHHPALSRRLRGRRPMGTLFVTHRPEGDRSMFSVNDSSANATRFGRGHHAQHGRDQSPNRLSDAACCGGRSRFRAPCRVVFHGFCLPLLANRLQFFQGRLSSGFVGKKPQRRGIPWQAAIYRAGGGRVARRRHQRGRQANHQTPGGHSPADRD